MKLIVNLNMVLLVFYSCFVLSDEPQISSEDAEVLSVVLGGFCKSKSKFFLLSTTVTSLPKNKELYFNELNSEALINIYNENEKSIKIELKCNSLVLKSEEEIDVAFKHKPKKKVSHLFDKGWAAFRETYPNIDGFVGVSRPGYSLNHKYALVYLSSTCGELCGDSSFIQLAFENGKWIFVKNSFVSHS